MSVASVLRPRFAAKVCQRAVRLPAAGLSLPKRLLMRERSSTTTGAGLCFEVHQEAAASIMAPCTSTSGVEDGSKARSRRWICRLRHVGAVGDLAHVPHQQGAGKRGLADVGVAHEAEVNAELIVIGHVFFCAFSDCS